MLTDGSLRRQLVAAGLARSQTFTWQAMARRTVEVYQEVAAVAPSCLNGMNE